MVKAAMIGLMLGLAGCAHRALPDCEAHLVPIQVPTVPVELPSLPADAPVIAEPHL